MAEKGNTVSIPAFHKMLVLAQWALGIFNEVSFENISPSELRFLNDLEAYYRDPRVDA